MNFTFKRPLYLFVSCIVINGMLATTLLAEPIYHPSGPKLTFGGMTQRQLTVSDMGNPAHPASIPYPEGDSGLYGGGLSIGLGIEYDGNDNLFKLLDRLNMDLAATTDTMVINDKTIPKGLIANLSVHLLF